MDDIIEQDEWFKQTTAYLKDADNTRLSQQFWELFSIEDLTLLLKDMGIENVAEYLFFAGWVTREFESLGVFRDA